MATSRIKPVQGLKQVRLASGRSKNLVFACSVRNPANGSLITGNTFRRTAACLSTKKNYQPAFLKKGYGKRLLLVLL